MFPLIAATISSEELDCVDSSGETATFLANYTPSASEYSVDDIFPFGKEMLKTWWKPPRSQFANLKNSGFNAVGPWHGRPRTNEFINSASPVTQTIKLSPNSNYDVWVKGTGSVTLSGATSRTLSQSDGYYTFNIPSGSTNCNLTVTVSGTLTHVQVQRGWNLETGGTDIVTTSIRNIDNDYIKAPKDEGLKSLILIRSPAGLNTPNTTAGYSDTRKDVEAEVPKFLAADTASDTIIGWEDVFEEAIFHSERRNNRDYQADEIRLRDSRNLPVSVAERSDSTVWGSTTFQADQYSHFSAFSPQRYMHEYQPYHNRRFLKRQTIRLVEVANRLGSMDGYSRLIAPLLGCLGQDGDYRFDWDITGAPTDITREQLYDRVLAHDILMALNGGATALKFYDWTSAFVCEAWNGTTCTNKDFTPRNSVNKIIKRFTDAGLDQAYLWGQRKTDLSISGPTQYWKFTGTRNSSGDCTTRWNAASNLDTTGTITFANANVAGTIEYCGHCSCLEGFVEPQIDWVNIQLGTTRYVIATNSHGTQAYSFTISGFPVECIKATIVSSHDDSLVGSEVSIQDNGNATYPGYITTTALPAHGHVAYKIESRSTTPPTPLPTLDGIQPDDTYPGWWKYDGTRTLFRGAPISGEHFVWANATLYGTDLTDFLTDFAAAGGNFMRLTMVDFTLETDDRVQPFGKDSGTGKFDLRTWNSTYWSYLNTFLSECKSRDICVQLELFDPWYMRNSGDGLIRWWAESPWAPGNNINYGTCSGVNLIDNYNTWELQIHPFHRSIVNPPSSSVTGYLNVVGSSTFDGMKQFQEKFVEKIVSIVDGELNIDSNAPYDNVLFQVENESPAGYSTTTNGFAWAEYWAGFIKARSSGRYVSDMQSQTYIGDNATHAIDVPSKFDFADCSQLSVRKQDTTPYTRDEQFQVWVDFRAEMIASGDRRPINNEKIYSRIGPYSDDGSDTNLAIDRFFISLFSGNAAIAMHPSEIHRATTQGYTNACWWTGASCTRNERAGEGFTDGQGGSYYSGPDNDADQTYSDVSQALTAAKWIDDHADIDLAKFTPLALPETLSFDSVNIDNRWCRRNPNECYGMENAAEHKAIFFWTREYIDNQIQQVQFDFTPWGTGSVTISWYNLDTGATSGPNTIAISNKTSLFKPTPQATTRTRWFCIVKKV